MRLAAIVLAGALLASPALADPCEAIPDKGPLPAWLHKGATFAGPVNYVGDGDSLCVQVRPGRTGSVEVRLADFYAPELHEPGGREARSVLADIALGRRVLCRYAHRSWDRAVAVCWLDGKSIGARLVEAGALQGGRGR